VAQLKFTPGAEKDLARLHKPIARLIYRRLIWLAKNFDFITPVSLQGELKDYSKFRVGDYRILYTHDGARQFLIVHFIRHRREVYKDR
jgi:mRNA interferase RelE/StbE